MTRDENNKIVREKERQDMIAEEIRLQQYIQEHKNKARRSVG